MNLMRSGGNPQSLMMTMLQNSPAYGEIMSFLNKNNGDARTAFYDMAKQKGVDPNQILDMMK